MSSSTARAVRVPMALVVLLRGVNVGNKRFSTTELAEELEEHDTASIGAAGTFVVRGRVAQPALRKRIADWLPFDCEIIMATGAETLRAIEAGGKIAVPEGAKRFATVMEHAPRDVPELPFDTPDKQWGVRVAAVEGRFALGLRRSVADAGWYPNEIVEKRFGLKATTRDWGTMEKIAKTLEA